MLQAQVVQNIVIAGVVVITHGRIQLALGIQHINNGTGAYFITNLRCLDRTLAGNDALLARSYLLDISIDRPVQVARILYRLATQAFFAVLGIFQLMAALAHS